MKLEMKTQMRLEQKMMLAPRMIQSMEILQLPILALQERIEQELNSNPVLEVDESSDPEAAGSPEQQNSPADDGEKDLVISTDSNKGEDFERITNLDDNYQDYMERAQFFSRRFRTDEPDKKLEAIKNTAAPPQSLHEHLSRQWGLVEAETKLKKAGELIIDYIAIL